VSEFRSDGVSLKEQTVNSHTDTPIHRYTHTGLAVFSALLYILSFPKFNYSSLAWIALVPLSLNAIRSTPSRAFYVGWISGTLAYSGILYWIAVTFLTAGLSWFLALTCLTLLAAYMGLFWGAWAWFVAWMTKIPSNPPLL
jgi:apolipoprotein N-acyltransferase